MSRRDPPAPHPSADEYAGNDEAYRREQEIEELKEAIGLLKDKIEDLGGDVDLDGNASASRRRSTADADLGFVESAGALNTLDERRDGTSDGDSAANPTSNREDEDGDLGYVASAGALDQLDE
ncbi:hypothetical protein [Halapricum hydrolyticum]|uniref:Uncharacterized protein n=1 Tax=Halapricum hydrolyticum TaxID=2979991 RepID=A0AAE3I9A6_9EURY|nr:hypothetical protein [Halapricum hydrolyticum]MCU4716623.1 hypothetical protein [Halapricum hydrolyticum]MCU4725772.1 hypothetical protein [Halapricum hydrolyticum]